MKFRSNVGSSAKCKGKKGVSIMECDTPCPITSNNITSFNLYNACIDPSCRYQGAIAAQGSAQLSFRGRLNPSHYISGRQKEANPAVFQPCPWTILLPRPLLCEQHSEDMWPTASLRCVNVQ